MRVHGNKVGKGQTKQMWRPVKTQLLESMLWVPV